MNEHLESSLSHRFGPCEDDAETVAPYIGILPDESDSEEGSPLDFSSEGYRRIGDDEEPEEVVEDYDEDLAREIIMDLRAGQMTRTKLAKRCAKRKRAKRMKRN